MTNELKKTLSPAALELYNLTDYKRGKKRISKTDFQPLYFFAEKVREALKAYDTAMRQGVSELKPLNDNIFAAIKALRDACGKIGGKNIPLEKDESGEALLYVKAWKCFYTDKATDRTNAMSEARAKAKKAALVWAYINADKEARKAKRFEALTEAEKATAKAEAKKAATEAKKAVSELEKAAGNCTTSELYNNADAFAKLYLYELARVIRTIVDGAPAAIVESVKAKKPANKQAKKPAAKKQSESKTGEAKATPANK